MGYTSDYAQDMMDESINGKKKSKKKDVGITSTLMAHTSKQGDRQDSERRRRNEAKNQLKY